MRLQVPKRHLAQSESGVGAFEPRPGIVVSADELPHFIIDTKWKLLREEASREAVSSADIYQMLAYGHRYDCSDVVLLYPHHAGLKDWVAKRATYAVEGHCDERVASAVRVSVATVDLADLASVPGQLRRIFIDAPLVSAA